MFFSFVSVYAFCLIPLTDVISKVSLVQSVRRRWHLDYFSHSCGIYPIEIVLLASFIQGMGFEDALLQMRSFFSIRNF